ncbi:Lipopolysaccharide-binding protein [Geodia barretti]|uniref:Lipopolysaccharide-binding protein n=1 Tax=Geodia barretti TaxID=519541 RepID=A0AA35XJH5_GEOBA|nr:Lipopolysaccharide-binding protein [Geodia barretti]
MLKMKPISSWLTALLLLTSAMPGSSGSLFSQEPGFRVTFTKKGLDYVFGPVLRDGLLQLSIPDIQEENKVKVVGKVKYYLTEITVGDVGVPSTSLEARDDQLMRIHISGMSLAMHAKWKYKQKSWPKIGDDGTVDLKAKDMSLSQTVSVRNDGSGRLVVLAADCSFDVRKISVKFHGGASWLYNLFTSFIEGKIKDHLRSQVCKMVTGKINEFGKELPTTLPVSIQVSDGVEVSCAILGDPVLSSSYLLTNHDGEFMSAEHSQEVPISPASLPAASSVDPTSKMVFIWLTSYTFDTAAYIYKGAAYMDYSIKNEEVPNVLLKTTADYKSIVPELYRRFPNKDVEYIMETKQPPSLLLSRGQARIVGEAEASILVVESGVTPQLAFSLTVSVQCDVEFEIQTRSSGQVIAGDITSFTTEISNIDSVIGEIDPTPFQELLHTMVQFMAIPHINQTASRSDPQDLA